MPTPAEVKEQVRKDWTDNAKPWKAWREKFAVQMAGATRTLVEAAGISPGMKVLDLASGTGEPAFSIARTVGREGHVTATDLVPAMLAVIDEVVQKEGIENMTVEVADMEKLSYANGSFHRVTSRFGIMFPPDPVQALKEMRRVLIPDGKVALMVWGPPTGSFWTAFLGPFMKRASLPPPPPDAPSPLRFARPGSASEVLREAGLSDVEETTMTLPMHWPGGGEELFRMQKEFVPQLFERYRGAMTPSDFESSLAEMKDNFVRSEKDGVCQLDGLVHVVTASR